VFGDKLVYELNIDKIIVVKGDKQFLNEISFLSTCRLKIITNIEEEGNKFARNSEGKKCLFVFNFFFKFRSLRCIHIVKLKQKLFNSKSNETQMHRITV
jgi:hypothetical protein